VVSLTHSPVYPWEKSTETLGWRLGELTASLGVVEERKISFF
jgi:hypothetical protein